MAGVVLEGVSRVFPGAVVAVNRVSLAVRDQEFLVLVGPSGCGKSTTLRMIAGLEEVTEGEISIGGQVVNHLPPKDRNIAMVFQNYALYPHMTVYKNMSFGLELRHGASRWKQALCRVCWPAKAAQLASRRQTIDQQVRGTARSLGIEPLLDRLPRQLSGGERQRVALGRAIVRQPAAFLFDEPLSNLDARLRVEMRHELKLLHRRLKATMVYVTHDQVEALTLGDRIAVMNGGEIQQIGTPLEVYQSPRNRFVAGFLGAPGMNFIAGEVESDENGYSLRMPGWSIGLTAELARRAESCVGKQVELGIRPEDIHLQEGPSPGAIRVLVESSETLGDSWVVHLLPVGTVNGSADAARLVGKFPVRQHVVPGEEVWVSLAMERGHLFDSVSGENLP